MTYPHLSTGTEADAPEEAAALYIRAHQKFGAAPLPLALVAMGASPVLFRDAMLNLEKVIGEIGQSPRGERLTLAVGLAAGVGAPSLAAWFDALADGAGVPALLRKGAVEAAITCRAYNGYFRAHSLIDDAELGAIDVQLRASPFQQSPLTKRLLETLCVAVSVANGCKSCASAHVATALTHGATRPQIDEAIRLQAVIVSMAAFE